MNSVYKYIHFVCVGDTGKTKRYSIRNNRTHTELAVIAWYGPWREYAVNTRDGMVFNKGCLDDISDFLRQLKEER